MHTCTISTSPGKHLLHWLKSESSFSVGLKPAEALRGCEEKVFKDNDMNDNFFIVNQVCISLNAEYQNLISSVLGQLLIGSRKWNFLVSDFCRLSRVNATISSAWQWFYLWVDVLFDGNAHVQTGFLSMVSHNATDLQMVEMCQQRLGRRTLDQTYMKIIFANVWWGTKCIKHTICW